MNYKKEKCHAGDEIETPKVVETKHSNYSMAYQKLVDAERAINKLLVEFEENISANNIQYDPNVLLNVVESSNFLAVAQQEQKTIVDNFKDGLNILNKKYGIGEITDGEFMIQYFNLITEFDKQCEDSFGIVYNGKTNFNVR